ncbi:MAG: AAA family ATPase [Streptococcaceae bacterium]|jgi:type II secretory pathway predicted ATPase ExeA|nr:AAA family ATPase [Streptococcaceae bacterium]
MNYTARYGLEFNPFAKNSKDQLIETNDYKQITQRLKFLVDHKGFGVLTGEPGRGKTTTIRHWTKQLSPSLFNVVYTSLSTLTLNEFYRHLAEEFGLVARHRKSDNYKCIQAEINRLNLEKRITPVFIIDEANYISSSILNDFKMLFNFEMDSKDRAIVLLMGTPTLNNTLRLKANEALRQRITMNYNMGNLSKADSRTYIKCKLQSANAHQMVFDEPALEAIINAASGTPRIINKICDMCLIIGNQQNAELINTDIALAAVNEIELG